jgi:DNA-binding NarL/FixJ family response regulator
MISERRRLILADDHACLRRATVEWIERSGGFEVVAEVGTATDALDAARRLRPDIAILDVDMPGRTSFEIADEIRRASPQTKIVFLSGYCTDRYIADAIAAKASAYVIKTDTPANLLTALRKAAEGATYFSPEVRERIVIDERGARLGASREGSVRAEVLTGREREVLRHVAKGLTKRDIAKILHLSPRTVERHVANVMAKLSIHDRVGLTRYAIREGFVEP